MSRGQYTGRPAGQDAPADPEAEAAATATAIAGLRRRLRRPGTLEHPAVKHELRMLEDQVFVTVQATAHGKHRSPLRPRAGMTAARSAMRSDSTSGRTRSPRPRQRSSSGRCGSTRSGPETRPGARWPPARDSASCTPPCTPR